MKPLVVQFSGGRTSAFMSRFLQLYYPERELIFTFENTGKEDPRTLDFVNECDKRWNLGVVWLEAVVYVGKKINGRKHIFEVSEWLNLCSRAIQKKKLWNNHFDKIDAFAVSTKHKVVNYETASRDGKPFEDVIKKFGLPNSSFPHCTRELKQRPLTSYLKSIGLDNYETAIGIRADEAHRINRKNAADNNLIYPLTDLAPVTKKMIRDFWANQDFDLGLKDYEGNCDLCFKKGINKCVTIIQERPATADWWVRMGNEYSHTGAGAHLSPRQMYRGYRTAEDLVVLANVKRKMSLIQEQPIREAFLNVVESNPEWLENEDVRIQAMRFINDESLLDAMVDLTNQKVNGQEWHQPGLFSNPEFDTETDCFCKST